MSLYRKFHWKETGNKRDAAGEGWSGYGCFSIVECDVRNDRKCLWDVRAHTHKETHIHYVNYKLSIREKLSREMTVEGESCTKDSWFALRGEGTDCIIYSLQGVGLDYIATRFY